MPSGKLLKRFGGLAAFALALAAGREYYARSIVPLRQRAAEMLRETDGLGERMENARKTIAETRAQEQEAQHAQSELGRIRDELPKGPATVALPAVLKAHFARSGIDVALVRMNEAKEAPGLPGYEHHYCSMALPIDDAGRNIATLLLAVSGLRQQVPFVRVLDFSIRPDPENPGGRVGSLGLVALTRK